MRKTLLLVLIHLTMVSARTTAGGYGAFGPCVALLNYKKINASFQRYGFTSLSNRHWLFGGGGYALTNRVLIGGAGWGGSQSVVSESLRVLGEISYGGGEFRTGYVLFDSKHLLVVPGLGIGGGGYTISLTPENRTVPSFDTLLTNPGRTSTVQFSGFSLNPQLALILPVSFIGLELRGGYNIGPLGANWRLEEGGTILRGPEMSKGSLWFSLNVILGGFSHEKSTSKTRIEIERESIPAESTPSEGRTRE